MPSQLPTGTVTLLFSDIEGSTRLLEHLGGDYEAVLGDCRRVLLTAFEAAGGREVDTQGDALFVAFARAGDAVTAAVAAQQALEAHPWPEGGRCRVRMGLHTGEPTPTAGGYVGMDVHRGARICAAAYGSQVLLSGATRDLLEPRVDVRDLGEHRLKDIPRPERLFQLVIPGLESDFPPPRSLSVTNLPQPATELVGRRHELEDVRGLVRMPGLRLVTLTGSGGSGKTRLAVEAALGVLEEFDGGTFFVSLAALEHPDQVLPTIAHVLGIRERPGEHLAATLAGQLRARKLLLLLLDNFERVVGAAPDVAGLLADCPELTVLATSRERLHVLAEREYPLSPLPEADAVALFEQRARAASPGFVLSDDRHDAVSAIVRRVDGLPLAVELAASYARVLPPQAIAERLERRLAFLTGGPRDLPERQRTLRATIDWSHSLLQEAEQALFAQAATFANGFTIEAAQAVSASEEDALPVLLSLRDKNLIVAQQSIDEQPRFLMLDTVHEYALERLDARVDADAVRRRHAEHFVHVAETAEPELTGAEQALWLGRLEQEHENLEAALTWAEAAGAADVLLRLAGALWRFWFVRGHLSAGGRWLDKALAEDGAVARLRAKVLLGASALADLRGEHGRARSLAERGLELARDLDEPEALGRALVTLANIVSDEGDLERAARLYEEAAALARAAGMGPTVAGTIANLSYLALRQGDWERAEELAGEAVGLFRDLGHATGTADSLLNLGFAAIRLGRWPAAFESIAEGLHLYAQLGHREGVVNALEGLAATAAACGATDDAAVMLGAAESLRETVGALLEPHEREQHEQTVAALQSALSGADLASGRARGAALALGEAVDLGLEVAARASGAPSGGAVGPIRPLATRQ